MSRVNCEVEFPFLNWFCFPSYADSSGNVLLVAPDALHRIGHGLKVGRRLMSMQKISILHMV